MQADDYRWWREALAGNSPPVHEGQPQCGFFYRRQKNGPRIPVAIWKTDAGDFIAVSGFTGQQKSIVPEDEWTWVCSYPVTEETYRAAVTAGAWPDDPPPAPAATSDGAARPNTSDSPADALRQEIEGEIETTREFLSKPIRTQADADRAAVWAKRVLGLAKRAEDSHKREKEPHLAAGRAVDQTWFPLRDAAKALASKLKSHLEPFLLDQRRQQDAERRQAEAEAERLRQAAAEADNDERQVELIQQAQAVEKRAEPAGTRAGRTGATVALRTEKRAKIVDYPAAHLALRDHPDMKALVEQLANRAVRAGMPLAGVEVEEVTKAA